MTAPKKIEELDTNFKLASGEPADHLRWVDAFDRDQLALRGFAWLEENYAARSFRRLPDRAAEPLTEGVQILSHHPASAFVAFATESADLSVRMTISDTRSMMHMPVSGSNGVELYLREGTQWLPVATGIPVEGQLSFECRLFSGLPKARREFRLYLPLYRGLQELRLGFEPGAILEPQPVPAGQKPIFVYGTSVTQGGCASTAGSDFLSIAGRILDTELINFGFSGNGRGEPEIAELISEIDPEMFVLNFTSNCPADLLEGRLDRFIDILRSRHPLTPVVIVTLPCYDVILTDRARYDASMIRRDVSFDIYTRKRKAGDAHLHLVDGFGLTPIGQTGTYVDGLHPTSSGFTEMGKRLAAHLEMIRLWERHWRSE